MSIPNADTGILGSLIRLYQAGYGHQPDSAGLEYWYGQATHGQTLGQIANTFVHSAGLDNVSKDAFIVLLYANVLGRVPDQTGIDYWNASQLSYGQILASFADSAEFAGKVTQGVFSVTQQAIAGTPINSAADLIGTPAFHLPAPQAPVEVIREVPVLVNVPTAEADVVTFNADGTVSTLAQKADGSMLFGSGNTAQHWQTATNTTTNTELGLNVIYRQSAEEIVPTSMTANGVHVTANYTADAGTQDGSHGAPVQANRSAVSVDYSISGGPGALGQDGTHAIFMDWDGVGGTVNTLKLTFGPGGEHLWREVNTGTVVIADDPLNQFSAQNSQNFAFPLLGGVADVPAGDYSVTIREVALVGLDAGHTVASLTAHITLV